MFGIDPKQISWLVTTFQWVVVVLRQIAEKLSIDIPAPPEPPQ